MRMNASLYEHFFFVRHLLETCIDGSFDFSAYLIQNKQKIR